MKAIVHHTYGPPDVLRLEDLDTPTPGEGEVLVRVQAASVNPADWHLMRGEPRIARLSFGLRAPRDQVPGCDLAGRVEAVGAGVTTCEPGDEMFGSPFEHGLGALAEYASVHADLLAPKPTNLSFEEAATVPLAAQTALHALRDHGGVEAGQRVLIIGASGGVGTFAVQIAKALRAEVTGVCSDRNVELVRSLGADHVVDYTREDITADGRRYDLVFQVAGTLSPAACRRAANAEGTLVLISGDSKGRWIGPLTRFVQAKALSPFVSQRFAIFTVQPNRADLAFLTERIEAGEIRPAIDRSYPLSEVPDAIRYLEEGHARGKVAINVGDGAGTVGASRSQTN